MTYLQRKSLDIKTATLELPAVLVHATEDFNFTGKSLWRIGEGLDHKLNDEPTDQQARTVRDRSQSANPKRRRRRRQQRQPAIQRQPPPRETAPPTIEISPAPPPATIGYQRSAMTKTQAPTLTSTIQRPPSPAKIQKQSRRSEPVLTSSPVANQPEPMTISPEDPADLNIAFSDTSSTFDPETAKICCDKKLTTEKLDM